MRIEDVVVQDVRYPTSRTLDGSDATHSAPDYSVAYVTLRTFEPEIYGNGLAFTLGRGTEIVVKAIESLTPFVIGRDVDAIRADMRAFWRDLTQDSQLRWLGPEKGVTHLAAAALVNAVWDLLAKVDGKPLWKLLMDMDPDELVGCLDFAHIRDVLNESEAADLLKDASSGREEREQRLLATGLAAYTTSPGWMGYSEEKIHALATAAVLDGWSTVKMKVGGDPTHDRARAAVLRDALGTERTLLMDANQVWDVDEAIACMAGLAPFSPGWIEEPTSPDDILGHARIRAAIAPVKVATGEHVHNRVMFKQLLQAGALDVCQIDVCRLGGINEVLAVLLMAAKFGVPVCPHAGGVGLCEQVQHIAMFDQIAVAGTSEGRIVEYVDNLHEHFVDPVHIDRGRYRPPSLPGFSTEIKLDSLEKFTYPLGPEWQLDGRALVLDEDGAQVETADV